MVFRTARSRLALLAGAAVAVTAVGALAQTMNDPPAVPAVPEPPTPPAPPSSPTPPAPPAPPAPGMGRQFVIVEKSGEEDGDEYVRTITRDGTTYVINTSRPLSDAEIEARIAGVAKNASSGRRVATTSVGRGNQRVVVIDDEDETVTDIVAESGCRGKNAFSNVDTSEEREGKVTRVRIRTCGQASDIERHAMAEAVQSIREARAEIANDKSLSDSIRKQVLQELDAEIAKLNAKG